MGKRVKILITGGAGFIGNHAAIHFLNQGHEVGLFDNLSRPGAELNIEYIRKNFDFRFMKGSISDPIAISKFVKEFMPDSVIHLAAQVAVTKSIDDPMLDFYTNSLGTINLLEAIRKYSSEARLIYSSTNKVYGDLENLKIVEHQTRYRLQSETLAISESYPLDFHSPYGCSKGSADSYVSDYARIYGLNSVILRQSCIYGERQFGVEDQGWISWFTIAALLRRKITIFGNGKQVRDALWVDDLVNLYEKILNKDKFRSGKTFNVGGGIVNSISILELIEILENKLGINLQPNFKKPRKGDQKFFVSDNSKVREEFEWEPRINLEQGLDKLISWTEGNLNLIKGMLHAKHT